jgi:hypothetical protein
VKAVSKESFVSNVLFVGVGREIEGVGVCRGGTERGCAKCGWDGDV